MAINKFCSFVSAAKGHTRAEMTQMLLQPKEATTLSL